MSEFTADAIGDLTGKRAIITGANSGLGLQTAVGLARKGAHVVLACRSEQRGRDAEQRVRSLSGSEHVHMRVLDLANLASVRDFAAGTEGPLDLLVNNAGVMATPRSTTADGFELQFGTNHLGHFALTGLLLRNLHAATSARVVTLSSLAHKRGRLDFGDLQSERGYRRWGAYGQSKIANLYFMVELDRRARAAGWDLVSVAAHPGLANTNLTAGMQTPAMLDVFSGFVRLMSQSDAAGALPTLYAATAPDVRGGDYYGPSGPGETRGAPRLVAPVARVLDRDIAVRLWNRSVELTGVDYASLQPAG
ncbi:SDR family NAD(P)-dependent oxidoreductase [Arthrobacter cheniae]|uniref:SDR family NAD(P)-dependent oxidoreductase n=1 Tax=Arthrobacter cheniae TaxID=1258888 RepID=A0A3A5MEE9_9MICC|nr:oxidoreductase [Arthrobacter cheniae]RJT82095.1 SDR family NAD(P)-dependent oxidoreductase [Arthrobacter cheniae]